MGPRLATGLSLGDEMLEESETGLEEGTGKGWTLARARSLEMQYPSSEAPRGQQVGQTLLSLRVILTLGLACVEAFSLPMSGAGAREGLGGRGKGSTIFLLLLLPSVRLVILLKLALDVL